MRKLLTICFAVVLVGCETTAVRDAQPIRVEPQSAASAILPIQTPVAFYVDKQRPESGINLFGPLEEVAQTVAEEMFSNVEKLSSTSDFELLFKLKGSSDWDQFWGRWISEVTLTVVDRRGEQVFQSQARAQQGGRPNDIVAAKESLAEAVKELLVTFSISQDDSVLGAKGGGQSEPEKLPSFKELLADVKPGSSGTGFFINDSGSVATAAHVIADCFYVEVVHDQEPMEATVSKSSLLLDLAVLNTKHKNSHFAHIGKNSVLALGNPVFVAGYPLSNILSDSPSLSIGIVSSRGGLKGAQGTFQFSAQVQPGNSGGPIVDYRGNLVGMVSSTLNQEMLLQTAGTTSQNVNFGIGLENFLRFMDKQGVGYISSESHSDFESASAEAVQYTTSVVCYE